MSAYRKIPIETLETERLILRPIAPSDAPRMQGLFPHENVVRYLTNEIPWPYPADGAESYLRHVLPLVGAGEHYVWAIVRKGHEEEGLIGNLHLMPVSDVSHRGFWIGEAYWGQGYMREAVHAANDFAFDRLEMTELLLNNAEPNVASHRLKEISGAEIIGHEEREYVGGRFRSILWRLTAEAWRGSKVGQ